MSKNPNKRIVYIWPENLHYWENMPNKSETVNRHLASLQKQIPGQTHIETEIEKKLKAIDERTDTKRSTE